MTAYMSTLLKLLELEEEASMECYVAIFPTFSSQFAFRLKEPKIFIFQSPPSPRDEMFCALIISGTWLARVCRIGITSLGAFMFSRNCH